MEKMKERLEQEIIKLKVFKHNLMCIKEDLGIKFDVDEEQVVESTFYDIFQNTYSISLLFSSCQYSNATTCFFVELFNYYQDLPQRSDYPYRSVSQGLTTYCLKEFARNKMIKLISYNKIHQFDLHEYMEMLGNYDCKKSEVQMYCCYFYKKRSLNEKDIPLIKSMAHILKIDFSNIKIVSKDDTIYLKMKNKYKFHQLLTGTFFKNIYNQRKVLYTILKEYKDYLFNSDDEEEQNKRLLK